MTPRELDVLRQYLADLRTDIRALRQEASEDHSLVRAEIRNLASRVESLEDQEAIEESRRAFRNGLLKNVMAANAAIAVLIGAIFAVLDHL